MAEAASPLLGDGGYYVDDATDFNGRPAVRSKSGGWRSSLFIIGAEVCERFAHFGIASNLINYLTGPLQQTNATAVTNVTVWHGVLLMLPLLGAFVADAYVGRYRTVLFSSLLYLLGLVFLTLSTILSLGCGGDSNASTCSSPSDFQVAFSFFSLYLVAIGFAGQKPCSQAFGADQFDETNPEEQKSKSSFFTWWCFGGWFGTVISTLVVNYIQEYVGWEPAYGATCLFMALSLTIFLVGTPGYRFKLTQKGNPFSRIAQVFVAAIRRSRWPMKESECLSGTTRQFRFLNRAAIPLSADCSSSSESTNWITCSVEQVEEVKGVLRLIPIWVACLTYGIFSPQSSTFFTKQGGTIDRKVSSNFLIPAAVLQCFIGISVVLFLPIYDRILVPIARSFTGLRSGITPLQRIGTGMFLSILCMVMAALVEMKRLKTARDSGLVDLPMVTVPMSIWWLLPQYLLYGISQAFTMAGLQEFFYDQMPDTLRSIGMALYLSIYGLGSLLGGFLVSLTEKLSSATSEGSWFNKNLNRAHLDYFYCLLACLSGLGLCFFLFFAQSYVYKSRLGLLL